MIELAVNGTLMKGLELNKNLVEVGARFIRVARTKKEYRLFSIDEIHPAMYRDYQVGGNEISVEVWEMDGDGLASVLLNVPTARLSRD